MIFAFIIVGALFTLISVGIVIYGDVTDKLYLGIPLFVASLIFIVGGCYSDMSETIYNEYQLQSGDIVCCSTIGRSELTDLYNCLDNKTYYSQSNVIKLGVCEE